MKYRVLVVDDSALLRRLISDIVNSFTDFEVANLAKDGLEALNLLSKNNYDAVILDVEMPKLNGIETLKQIKKLYPRIPVIMFSTLTKDGAELTLEALEIGAFDFVTKPVNVFKVNTEEVHGGLLEALSGACRIRVSRGIIGARATNNFKEELPKPKLAINQDSELKTPIKPHVKTGTKLVAIGTSTGGPKALQSVIPLLKVDIPAPVLVVQHMPEGFIESMAKRIDSLSAIGVKQAEHGEKLENGMCYIAPGGVNMRVIEKLGSLYIDLKKDVTDSVHRPSVDVLFYSLCNIDSRDVTAVIMTGMGSDGAKGMKNLHDLGHFCIAQDQASCAVFGMPGSAVRLNAVDNVVPLDQIAREISRRMEV